MMYAPPLAIAPGVRRDELEWVARVVADIAVEHYPDAESIVWKGSSFKPWEGPYDFFPGLSDLDMHVYRPGGLGDAWALRRDVFAAVGDSPPGSLLQLLILDSQRLPEPWFLLPGTYEVLHGGLPPIPEVTDEDISARDREDLAGAQATAARLAADIVDRCDTDLWSYLRQVRWMFPPVLFRAATVAGVPAREAWSMNRTRLLVATADIPELEVVRAAAIGYFAAAVDAGLSEGDPKMAEAALRAGHHLLHTAAAWFESR